MATEKNKRTSKTIERIYGAAIELLGEKGYTGATMDEIIAKAGVSKGAVYWHFKSKRDLFIELFMHWMHEFSEGYRAIFESDMLPAQKLKSLIEVSGEFLKENPEEVKIYIEFLNLAIKDHVFVERMLVVFEEYIGELAKVLEAGIESGEFKSIDADRTAELIVSTLDGLLLRATVDPNFDLDRALKFFSSFVFRALGCENQEAEK